MTDPRGGRVRADRARKLGATAAFVLLVAAVACSGKAPPAGTGEPPARDAGKAATGTNAVVTRVIDGDTIEVSYRQRSLDVRLIGIDTPESVAPGVPVQCFALAASRFTTDRLDGERVRLEFDVERIDRYGRTLAYVWLGDELFNETLVRGGYAFVTTYPPDVKYESRFLDAQRDARTHERGVWGRCSAGA